MAEGVFTIQADINPTIDRRALEATAAQISGQLNTLLSKQIKSVNISGSTQGFNPKTIEATADATSVLSTALDNVKKAFSSASDTAKSRFLALSNTVGITTKSVVSLGASLIENIKNSSRFNDSLAAITRSGAALKGLPDNFKELAAQINSGTSALDRAAAGGNQFAAAIQPITQLTVGIRSALLQVDTGIQSLGASLRQLAAGKTNTGVGLLADQTDLLRDKIEALATKTTPQFGQQLKNTFEKAAAQGPQALVDALQRVREEQGKAIASGGGSLVNVNAGIRSALFDIDKDVLSFTDRFAERFTRLSASIRSNFVAPVTSAIGSLFRDQSLNAGFFESLSVRFSVLREQGLRSFAAISEAFDNTFANTRVGAGLRSFGDDATSLGRATTSVFKDIKGQFQDLQRTSRQGVGIFDFDAATQSGNKFFSTMRNAVRAFATGAANANPLKNLLGGEGGGQAGAASLGLLLAPLNAIKSVLGALGSVAALPFKALGAGASVAAAPLGIIKNLLGEVTGEAGLGGLVTGGAIGVAAIVGIGTAAINTAAKFETYKVAFEGLFGPGQGQKVIDLALDFDQLTHFSLDTTIQAVEGLAGAIKNIQPEGALAILKQIGGAAAAIGAGDSQVQRVTLALTQISAAGRLTAQDLNQITQALPDISRTGVYAQIAKDLGVTNQKAKDLAQQGLVDSETGLTAVLKVANQVPGATEAMEKQSQTFKGLLTIVQTQLNKLLIQIGGPLLAGAKVVLQSLIVAFEKLAPVIEVVGNVIGKVFGFLGRITGLGSIFKSATDSINKSLKETGSAGGVAALGINEAINALSVLKNSVAAAQSLLGPALTDVNNKLAILAATKLNGATGFSGAFLGSIQGLLNSLSSSNLTIARTGILTLQEGIKDLADIKSPEALTQRVNDLKAVLATLDLPPDLIARFDDIFSTIGDQVAKAKTVVQEALTKTLAYNDSLKAAAAAHEAVGSAIANVTKLQKDHDAQIKTQTLQAQRQLDQSNQSLVDSNDRVAESQVALDKVLKGASGEDLEKADLSLASAKLRLRQIIEDEKHAQDALNNTQKTSIDLVGLSLDQIKARLNNVKLSLAAQKATAVVPDQSTKSDEQKSIDAANAAITKRDAELAVTDAIAAQNELRAKGSATDPERIAAEKTLAAAKREQAQQVQAQADAQDGLNKLKQKDVAFEEQLAAANKAVQTAKDAAAEADFRSAQSLFQAKGNIDGENQLLADRLKNQLPAYQTFLDAALKSTDARLEAERLLGIKLGDDIIPKYRTLADIINDINNGTGTAAGAQAAQLAAQHDALVASTQSVLKNISNLSPEFANLSGGRAELKSGKVNFVDANGKIINTVTADQLPVQDLLRILAQNSVIGTSNPRQEGQVTDQISALLANPDVVTALVAAILKDPKSDIRKIFQELFRTLNIHVDGFAEGGLINGTRGSFGQLVRVGEYGRSEAILPLENRPALQNLMRQPGILNPVLSALPRLSLPQSQSSLSGIQGSRSSGGSGAASLHQQNARDQALARAIAEELKGAGFTGTGKQIHVQNDFTLPNTNDPLSNLKVKQMAREVKRQLDSDW